MVEIPLMRNNEPVKESSETTVDGAVTANGSTAVITVTSAAALGGSLV